MLCRLQCAREAIRWRIADALPSSPRHSPSRRRLSRGGKPPVKVWLGGSTPNEITSGLRTSRSEFSLNCFQKGDGARGDTSNECALAAAHKKAPHGRCRAAMMERMKGIEPSTAAWEAAVLPLNYIRVQGCLRCRGGVAPGGNDSILAQRRKMSTLRALFLNPKKRRDSVAFRA